MIIQARGRFHKANVNLTSAIKSWGWSKLLDFISSSLEWDPISFRERLLFRSAPARRINCSEWLSKKKKSQAVLVGIKAYSAGKSPSFQQAVLAGIALLRLRNVFSYFTVLGGSQVPGSRGSLWSKLLILLLISPDSEKALVVFCLSSSPWILILEE